MKRLPARAAVVSLATLDLRARPDHRSELKSQLLLGERVEVRAASRDGAWWRVRNHADGYEGWSRNWGLVPCTPERARAWAERARGRTVVAYAEARTDPDGGGALVSPLFWNSRTIAGPARGGRRRVELPDGRRGWVPAEAVSTSSRSAPPLADRVRGLLGVPYLWGGRTPMAFDCSGLVQQLLDEQGIALPRDAHDQYLASRPLARNEVPRLGDLAFFGNPRGRLAHVGLMLGGLFFVHARGRVRINSLDAENPLCDRELLEQWRSVRRPLSGALPGTRGGGNHPQSP